MGKFADQGTEPNPKARKGKGHPPKKGYAKKATPKRSVRKDRGGGIRRKGIPFPRKNVHRGKIRKMNMKAKN